TAQNCSGKNHSSRSVLYTARPSCQDSASHYLQFVYERRVKENSAPFRDAARGFRRWDARGCYESITQYMGEGHRLQPRRRWRAKEASFPSQIWEKGTQPRPNTQLA